MTKNLEGHNICADDRAVKADRDRVSPPGSVADFYNKMGADRDYDDLWLYDESLYHQLHPILLRYLDTIPRPGNRALDAGCGTGAQTSILCRAGFRVDALDIAEELLRTCEAKLGCLPNPPRIVKGDVSRLPYLPDTFCVIVCFYNVLNHVPDYASALGEFYRTLKPGGHLFLEIEKTSLSDFVYEGLDVLFGGALGYDATKEAWLRTIRSPFATRTAAWTYDGERVSYWRFRSSQMAALCRDVGFQIRRQYGLSIASGLLPWSVLHKKSKAVLTVAKVLRRVDSVLSPLPVLRRWGLNTVYVLRKPGD